MKQFMIFTQPFCEANWLGALLTYKDFVTVLDPSLYMKSVHDLDMLLALRMRGFIDTNMALLWPEVVDRAPGMRLAVIRRPREEVLLAGEMAGVANGNEEDAMRRLDIALNEIESLSGVLRVAYDGLAGEAGLKRLFEFCLPYKWDREWYKFCAALRGGMELPNNALIAQRNLDGIAQTFGPAVAYYNTRLAERPRA